MKFSRRGFREIGRFQWIILIVFTFNGLTSNWANVGILFMAPKLDHWCRTNFTSFHSMNKTERFELASTWEKCRQPDSEYWLRTNSSTENVQWSKCDDIEYKEGNNFKWTVTQKYGLFCDREWYIKFGNTIYMCGFFASAITSGALADRFGRRTVVLLSNIIAAAGNLVVALSPSLVLYLFARFAVASSEMAGYCAAYILVMELLRKDQRILALGLGGPIDVITDCLLPGVATLLPNHEHFCYLLIAMIVFVFTINFLAMPESPRWLASRQRVEEAEKIVDRFARINRQNKDELTYLYQSDVEKKVHISPIDLLRTPTIRKRTLLLWCAWLSTVFVNYGILFDLADFGNDVRITLIFLAILQLPAWLIVVYMTEKLGRQCSLFISMLISGSCCLLMTPFVGKKSSILLSALALIGKTSGGNQFFLVYQHTPELYPTVMRTMGLGASSTVSRIAGMIAPMVSLLNEYWPPMSVVILGSIAILAAALIPLIPDTTGHELPQTIEEGEKFLSDHTYKLVLPPGFKCCCKRQKEKPADIEMADPASL